jgi:hypothetical protein
MKLACRLSGHRWRFRREGATVLWSCERGCGAGGERGYESPAVASVHLRHYARRPPQPVGLLAALAGVLHRGQRRNG